MRLIDADALVYKLGVSDNDIYCKEIIEEEPTAQPEIVRCKDCRYSDIFPLDSDADMPMKCLGIRYGGVYPYWYCEHAERREDG